MKCPHCQADNPEGVKFCGECGKSLQDELVCPQCGHANPSGVKFCHECGCRLTEPVSQEPPAAAKTATAEPTSFVNDRYKVKKKLGEGGKKKVYLVHDKVLDRDVAFALIKTENLDQDARKRVTREAQAMGKLGDNPHIVSIFDMGELNDQPYIVIPLMGGGDVEGLIEKAPDHKLPLDRTISIAKAVCRGLVFAHSKGVIHRDLKPGNVWLTDDGTAKIGDFGLAVMTDVSRLTMEGIMVGTVSYMPPEQAMGGEVTSKADLYSLGAMLYEMVTGRPPFVGDDSVSIIGQHINTQPISPTWHRADLPPAFESLIMLLLEKDPEKRPGSAKDVLAALESIEKGDIKESVVETQAQTENPIYRRIFIGRENELKTLQNAFDGAMSGRGALMMVVGEPGIGKTAICDQLSTFVTLKGGKALTGNCYEEGSLSLPYLAFVEAIRSYVLDRDTEDLKKELGSGATDVARIVSEIREKLHVEPREAQNPEEDRYRLMQAATSFLKNAAAVKPMLVILEDLHDADKGTLEMLSYVSRNLQNTRLMIVGTYRDVEVDRNHPLSAALAELRRVSSFGRVLLRGLNIDEVRRMLTGITHEEIPLGLADVVHRQTEGNPLFVQEVVRYLAEEGLIQQEEGKWKPTKDTPLEMNIPEGLRDVIGKRLSLLTSECNQLLSAAAVIGRDFTLNTLKDVSNLEEDAFVNALSEAVQLSVLEERKRIGSIQYRFTHAFFRQTLYEEMIAPRRLQLHQRIARSLERQYGKRLEEHATELAEHFSQSTDPVDLEKAVNYGELAAKRATSVFSFGEAVRLLEQALQVQRVLDPDHKAKLCDLLLELADALNNSGDPHRAVNTEIPEAFALAEDINDSDRASKACALAIIGISYEGGTVLWGTPAWATWAERADHYAKPNTIERAWADLAVGGYIWSKEGGATPEVENRILRAIELSRQLNNSEIYWTMALYRLLASQLKNKNQRWAFAEELSKYSREGVTVKNLAIALYFLAFTFLEFGKREETERHSDELTQLAERTSQAHTIILSMGSKCFLQMMDGNLEGSAEINRHIITLGEELGIPTYAKLVAQQTSDCHFLLGNTGDIEAFSTLVTGETSVSSNPRVAVYLGQESEIVDILEKTIVKPANVGTEDDMRRVPADFILLEAALMIRHKQSVTILLNKYADVDIQMLAGGFSYCVPQYLAEAASLLSKFDEARKYNQEAIKVCTNLRFRPGLALTRLQLAELLLDHYPKEKAEALEHLDFAIKEFREMKMQPSLEKALRRKDILKA
jgi:serine/threonine protein kinase/tetratricopeptide (TPR) repeat protein